MTLPYDETLTTIANEQIAVQRFGPADSTTLLITMEDGSQLDLELSDTDRSRLSTMLDSAEP